MPRKKPPGAPDHTPLPSREDQSEILDAAGAEHDPDTGALLVDESKIRELGAADTDSIRENDRVENYVNKRRGGEKVAFNTDDPLQKYEVILRDWPANTIDISVRRLTGTPVQHVIISRPKTGVELYDAVKRLHGAHPEAEYELKFLDSNRKSWRGVARITMPDTSQEQPMQHPGYPPGYAPPYYPPGNYPPGAYSQGAPPQLQAPAPSAAPALAPAPQVVVQPAPPHDMAAAVNMFGQVIEMVQRLQQNAAPPQAAPAPAPAPQPVFLPPPPPPPGSDPATQMEWIRQAVDLVQRMAPHPAATPVPAAAPAPAPQQAVGAAPPMPAPPGMVWLPPFGFVDAARLVQAISGAPPAPERTPPYRPRTAYQPPGGSYPQGGYAPSGYERGAPASAVGYRREPEYGRPDYGPGYEPEYRRERGAPGYAPPSYAPPGYGPPSYGPPAQEPQRGGDPLREAVSTLQGAMKALQGLPGFLGGQPQQQPYVPAMQDETGDEDNPLQVVEVGPAKLIVDRASGSMRGWETGFANLPGAMKWIGEQIDSARKAQAPQPQQQAPRRVLPRGYVEVDANYQPPPGYTPVPVDEDELPDPPPNIPPPLRQEPPQQQSEPWGDLPPQPWEQGGN